MKTKLFSLCIITLLAPSAFAQKKLPVVKANSIEVDIKDDQKLAKKAWQIVPQEKLDVYVTSGKKVTFYTDVDSIHSRLTQK